MEAGSKTRKADAARIRFLKHVRYSTLALLRALKIATQFAAVILEDDPEIEGILRTAIESRLHYPPMPH
jgi:hypothetical protein